MPIPNPLQRIIDSSDGVVADYAAALEVGADVDAWYQAMKREIKRAHLQATIAGRGGLRRMTPADYGRVGRTLRDEYAYLRQFARDVEAGRLSSAQIAARARLYSNHIQTSFWRGRDALRREQGYRFERRRLNPAEHCDDCKGYAAQGWQPIGTLPPPGVDSVCRANCRCTFEYSRQGR